MKSMHLKNYQTNSYFEQERSRYQQLIEQLTKENQMLKRQLQTLANLKHLTQDIHRAQTKEDEGSISDIRKSQQSINTTSKQTASNSVAPIKYPKKESIQQNQRQSKKMNSSSSEYQQKIEQLTNFLTNMKYKQSIKQSSLHVKEQINMAKVVQTMQNVIKMFENDRSILIQKIEELLLLISTYEKKEKEYYEKERQFELDLRIANEQLVIFKRLKKSK